MFFVGFITLQDSSEWSYIFFEVLNFQAVLKSDFFNFVASLESSDQL